MINKEKKVRTGTEWTGFVREILLLSIVRKRINEACRFFRHQVLLSRSISIPLVVVTSILTACDSKEDVTIQSIPQTKSTWESKIAQRRQDIEQAILQDRSGFEAFDTGSLGDATLEMIPFVVFRVLGELEPSVFSDEALNGYGFFTRKETPSGINGITWTQPILAADDGKFELRYMSRTCASCHTGRVRLANGDIRVLHGGTNTEINLHRFVGDLTKVLEARLADSNDAQQYQDFRQSILDMLNQKEAGWYWSAGSQVSEADASKEVATVTENIDAVLSHMREMNTRRLTTLGLLQKYSYDMVPNPPSLGGGAPGIIETAGLGAASLIPVVGVDNAGLVLPPGPSKADIPAVWKLDPAGYANWDSTIKGFSRSLTSSLAVVGDLNKVDIPANKKIQSFLGKLPPEPFPFSLDTVAAKRGEAVYNENCVGCHDPSRGRERDAMVFDVQADPARAIATKSFAVPILQKVVSSVCPQDQECTVVDPASNIGYVAGSLAGIWMQSPYMHNGSVPTLRQLLVPALRTSEPFLRGSISYDVKNGGWEWDPAKEKSLREQGDVALSLHDISQSGMGNYGHGSVEQQFISYGDSKLRIAWSDSEVDKPVVDDLIAYLLSL